MKYKYKYIVCGGTFDRLHAGHKAFLSFVFSQGRKVDIGLTTDEYIEKNKSKQSVLPFGERKQELESFLRINNLLTRARIIPIQDIYGLTLNKKVRYEAIVVSEETAKGAQEINRKRQQIGLKVLPIITFPLVTITTGIPLSSTLVREGKIGRHGEVYLHEKWTKNTLYLPEDIRKTLHEPFGELFTGAIPQQYLANPTTIVTVGDATTKRFNREKVGQALSVVDFTIERKKEFQSIGELGFTGMEDVYAIKNSPGTLSPDVWEVLGKTIARHSGLDPESQQSSFWLDQNQEMLKQVQHDSGESKRQIVVVDGEEDLLVLPLVLLLPLGYAIFYGQPGKGIVRIVVTEQAKEKVFEFLQKFTHG